MFTRKFYTDVLKLLSVITILTIAFKSNAQDKLLPSANPHGGISVSEAPQFVCFGWDDNGYSGYDGSNGTGAVKWILDYFKVKNNPVGKGQTETFDGTPIKCSFFVTTVYMDQWMSESNHWPKVAIHDAYLAGHEVGNHTYAHNHGETFTTQQWSDEIVKCNNILTKTFDPTEVPYDPKSTNGPGIPRDSIIGFRTPFLEYGVPLFQALVNNKFKYECTIEEGWEENQDGTNYYWPYTLDNGSPGHNVLVEWGQKQPMSGYPGLWELPVYCFIIPPDAACSKYGIPIGLRKKIKAALSWFDETSGKVTGFDYNLMAGTNIGGCGLNKDEYLATLKYTFDQHYNGNRSPMLIGIHSDYYSSKYTGAANIPNVTDRQWVIEQFITYVLSKNESRIVRYRDLLKWLKNPVPLSAGDGPFTLTITQPAHGTISINPQKAQYNKGDIVTVSITTEQGYQFSSWTGAASGSSNSVQVTMNTDKTISALVNIIQGQCPSKIDLLNTGTWSGMQDGKSTIANTFTVSGGVITCPYTVAKMSAPEAYDTWVSMDGELADGNMSGLSSISITYQSEQSLIISLPQPILDATGESFQVSVPSSGTLTTLEIGIDQFAKPDWTAPENANIPLKLDSIVSVSIQPDPDVSASAVSGTIIVSKLDLCGLIPVGIKQNILNDSELNIYGISKDYLSIYSSNSDKYTISVYTTEGKLVFNNAMNLSVGVNSINLNTSLSNSIYLIKVMNNHAVSYKKVAVVN